MTIRKAAAEDLQAIVSIYDEIHGREEAGEVTIGWIRDVYPVRKTAEDAISRGDMFVQEDETGAVTATGIINHTVFLCARKMAFIFMKPAGVPAARDQYAMRGSRTEGLLDLMFLVSMKKVPDGEIIYESGKVLTGVKRGAMSAV